jgi:hypothetical protein
MTRARRSCVLIAALWWPLVTAFAQPPAGSGGEPPRSPRESAAIDLTGQWVAIVNEDWRWRMVTPPKGDYTSVQPLNQACRDVADAWEPSQDGSCRAYGAPGLLRLPTRLRIEWSGDAELTLRTDAGVQVRRLQFGNAPTPAERTLQGHSVAAWQRTLPPPGGGGRAPAPTQGGTLKVTTSQLTAGWLRKNGVPYSEATVLTEYFDRFAAPNADEWLVVTTIVEDPQYLNGRFITSSHFKRESDRSKWNPQPCKPI